jgi:MFS family permease
VTHDGSDSVAASARPANWVTADVKRIVLTQTVFGFAWSLYLLMPKFLATELHAGPDVIGQVAAMGGMTGLLTVPFAARGLDRIDRRKFFRAGCVLIVLVSIGYTQVHAVTPLLYLLQGCVSASFVLAFNASAALLSDYAPAARLGQAIGWVGGANVAMNAVATLIAEPLAAHYGWNAVFALGVVFGSLGIALSFGLRNAPVRARASSNPPALGRAGRAALIVPVLVSSALMGAVFIAMFGFIQPYALSLGAREVSTFFLGFTLAAVGCRVLLGGVGDRLGRRAVSAWLLGGYALSALLVRELHVDLLPIYGFAFGSAHGLLYPTLNALMLELMPSSRRGLGMVMYNGAFNFGLSLGSLGWGMLATRRGYPVVYSVAAVVAVGAALLIAKPLRSARV